MKRYIKQAIMARKVIFNNHFMAGSLEDNGDGTTDTQVTRGEYNGEFEAKRSNINLWADEGGQDGLWTLDLS